MPEFSDSRRLGMPSDGPAPRTILEGDEEDEKENGGGKRKQHLRRARRGNQDDRDVSTGGGGGVRGEVHLHSVGESRIARCHRRCWSPRAWLRITSSIWTTCGDLGGHEEEEEDVDEGEDENE